MEPLEFSRNYVREIKSKTRMGYTNYAKHETEVKKTEFRTQNTSPTGFLQWSTSYKDDELKSNPSKLQRHYKNRESMEKLDIKPKKKFINPPVTNNSQWSLNFSKNKELPVEKPKVKINKQLVS